MHKQGVRQNGLGAMRKMAVYLGLVEDDRYDDDYYYDDDVRDNGRDSERIGSARSDRYSDRDDRDTVRVTESTRTADRDDDLARRRQTTDRAARDWHRHCCPRTSELTPRHAQQTAARPTARSVDPMKITTLHPAATTMRDASAKSFAVATL